MDSNKHKFNGITIPDMLKKLDVMYDKKEQIEFAVERLYKEYEQITEDIDLAETIIMHQSNKINRQKESEKKNFFDFTN